MSKDMLISAGTLRMIERGPEAVTVIPDNPETSLIDEAAWAALCAAAGGEAALIVALDVVDMRGDEHGT